MLNRVCTGSSSPRLRYRMMHQKIRPHTKKPTTSAAITEAIHRSYIRWACRLMPLARPSEVAERVADALHGTAREQDQQRRAADTEPGEPDCPRPCGRTLYAHLLLPPMQRRRGAKPDTWRQGVTDGRTLLDQALPSRSGVAIFAAPAYPRTTGRYRSRVEYTGVHAGAAAYLDAATAAPLHPVARQALLAALDDGWADPDRLYAAGRRARQLLEAAQAATAEALAVRPDELSFWPSRHGRGARRRPGWPRRAAAGRAHAGPLRDRALGGAARRPPGTATPPRSAWTCCGRLDLDAWRAAVAAPGVALASLISASHEVGTVQPVAAAAEACAEAGVPLYVDAAQSVGHAPVPPGWSLLTASAHKWGGPPGVGVLVVRKGVRWLSPYPGDDLYRPQPPGALDLPAVVAAAASLRAVLAEAATEAVRLSALVDRIRDGSPRPCRTSRWSATRSSGCRTW